MPKVSPDTESTVIIQLQLPNLQLGSWQLAAGKAGGGENVECCQTGCDAGTDYELLPTGVASTLIRDN